MLQLSEKGRNSHTNTAAPAWQLCARLLEGQLCFSSAVGELIFLGQQGPPQLPKRPHCSTITPCPPLHTQPSRQLLSSCAQGLGGISLPRSIFKVSPRWCLTGAFAQGLEGPHSCSLPPSAVLLAVQGDRMAVSFEPGELENWQKTLTLSL